MDDVEFAVRTIDESTAAINAILAGNQALIEKLTELNQSADVTNHHLESLTDTTQKSGEQNEKTGFSMSELNQGMEVINKTLGYAEKAYDATIGKSQAYAEQIRNLSQISGQSAEDTSRFVQVLDDWQVSAEDATAATKALTKQGLAPNIDTLAKLSGEYLSLNSVEDQNAFVTKNLGRAGLEWINVLKQGPDALREQAAGVNENLILNQKTLDQAEQLRLAQDQLNDTWQGLSITVGTKAAPAFTAWVTVIDKVINNTNGARDAVLGLGYPFHGLIDLTKLYGDTSNELQANLANTTTKMREQGQTAEELAAAQKAADEAAKAMSQTYQTILSSEQAIQSQSDSYADSVANLTAKQDELKQKISEAGWWETDKIAGYQAELGKIPGQLDALAAKNEEATNKMIYQNILSKDSVDGISAAEFARDQALGVSLGLFTEDAANRAIAMNTLATAFHDGAISADELQTKLNSGTLGTPPEDISKSWSGLQERITASTGASATKIDEGITKVSSYADETKNKTDAVAEGWNNASAAIDASVNDGIGNIQRYIDTLGTIPTSINTDITQTITGTGGAGVQSAGALGGGQSVVYNIYGPVSIGADHQLTEMLVVG